jgi:diguanylate cyclase (GGDEF)-like protein/PAS domain S-box-containing protein
MPRTPSSCSLAGAAVAIGGAWPPATGFAAAHPGMDAGPSAFDALFNSDTAGFAVLDMATGCFQRVNRRFCEMTGRRAEDLLSGMGPSHVVHPDDQAADRALWRDGARTGRFREAEKRYLHPDGRVVWARLSVAILARHPDGRPARCVAIVQDVTAGHEAMARQHASESLLRLTLEVGRIGSFQHDFASGRVQCGAETRAMYGLPPGNEVITAAEWFGPVLREDRVRLEELSRLAIGNRAPGLTVDYRIRRQDGEMRHFEARLRFAYDQRGRAAGVTGAIIDVTDQREAEARIAYIAHHDALTGLPNRALFRNRLEDSIARAQRGEGFAVHCLDLDRFKEVNDSLGHSLGDALLRAVAGRLREELREIDTVARLGGDEFAIIQSRVQQPAEATRLARRLIEVMSQPFELEGHQVVIGTSLGISLAPADGEEADTLLKNGDMALYRAKADGRGRLCFFEPEMDARMQARRRLEMDLRRALVAREFELFFQPIVEVRSRRVTGLEALLRWNHPQQGLVPPDHFIPLAEEIGLIIPLGEWVLEQACAHAARWPGDTTIAVNLSPAQFASRGLVDAVARALAAAGLDPGRLELEITETVMLQDTEATLTTLHRLKALGVRIAMDDFGTGYSSLSYLQRFPFDKVKIDRCFTRDLGLTQQSDAIIRAVAGLCQGLDMRTTAEGVETEEQFRALARKGCAEAQGYLFSRPCPAGEIPEMLARLSLAACAAEAGMLGAQ